MITIIPKGFNMNNPEFHSGGRGWSFCPNSEGVELYNVINLVQLLRSLKTCLFHFIPEFHSGIFMLNPFGIEIHRYKK